MESTSAYHRTPNVDWTKWDGLVWARLQTVRQPHRVLGTQANVHRGREWRRLAQGWLRSQARLSADTEKGGARNTLRSREHGCPGEGRGC